MKMPSSTFLLYWWIHQNLYPKFWIDSMKTTELRDLVAAWLALSIAFANLYGLGIQTILMSLVTVGAGFLLHELAHRAVARNFGLGAEFRADYRWLGLAILLSFGGLIFAAPGAVYTLGNRSSRQQMLISVAGPVTNILLAGAFYFVPGSIGSFGFSINAWLALFNMVPIGGLDGQKVLQHSKIVYGIVAVTAGAMVFLL
jgi:Zn-dependent protease